MPVPAPAMTQRSTLPQGVLTAAAWGLGFALGLALVVGGVTWFRSRPAPSAPWETAAIVANGAPGFSVTPDGKHIALSYILENKTEMDYKVASKSDLIVVAYDKDAMLAGSVEHSVPELELPIFIPAHKITDVQLLVALTDIPTKDATETDPVFHERLRGYLDKRLAGSPVFQVDGFKAFDEARRYSIDLPKWLSKPPAPPVTPQPTTQP